MLSSAILGGAPQHTHPPDRSACVLARRRSGLPGIGRNRRRACAAPWLRRTPRGDRACRESYQVPPSRSCLLPTLLPTCGVATADHHWRKSILATSTAISGTFYAPCLQEARIHRGVGCLWPGGRLSHAAPGRPVRAGGATARGPAGLPPASRIRVAGAVCRSGRPTDARLPVPTYPSPTACGAFLLRSGGPIIWVAISSSSRGIGRTCG